jgi:endoglucanase
MKVIIPLLSLCWLTGCHQSDTPAQSDLAPEDYFRINQVGYYETGPKRFVVVNAIPDRFEVINKNDESVYSGMLSETSSWEFSGETVRTGDFTDYTVPGTYRIRIEEMGSSHPFIIDGSIYEEALLASLKSNYFQRASMAIEESYGDKYHRPAGHPDTACIFHPSTGHDGGRQASPGGWYDAGDYGKYIVNAGISVGTMLLLYELYPGVYGDQPLNIPESGNGMDDLLDEIRYETDWMNTMQDADGGVFHKLTTKKFTGFVMPHETHEQRYFIGKSTAAALNYAAVMAMVSRIYEKMDPEYAGECLSNAEKAWIWAMDYPEEFYRNPSDISTGAYGDDELKEEFFWAAAELYITTQKQEYHQYISNKLNRLTFRIEESWRNYQDNIGYYSLLNPRSPLSADEKAVITHRLTGLADSLSTIINNHPYRIPIDHFVWGSNSDVLNLAIILAMAHHYTGEDSYLNMAIETVDYIFGKNATSYSFLTGVGDKVPMNIHHRPSGADGIPEPVPGFVVGGPNGRHQDAGSLKQQGISYPYPEPARAYLDVTGSYASNEVCLNWNAPLVFMLRYLEENMKQIEPSR